MLKSESLDLLKKECLFCNSCDLAKTRTNIVFSDGNPNTAKYFLIGEAPGENEDLSGIPFVGRAGKLLDEFLIKAGINRKTELYIANTVKCRPPKNRVPAEIEKSACRSFIEKQIDIVNPNIILLCGATALKSFYNTKTTISKIRGEIIDIVVLDKKYKAMPIFHPSYLLRNHSLEIGSPRGLMLEDLKKIKTL